MALGLFCFADCQRILELPAAELSVGKLWELPGSSKASQDLGFWVPGKEHPSLHIPGSSRHFDVTAESLEMLRLPTWHGELVQSGAWEPWLELGYLELLGFLSEGEILSLY